MKQSRLHRTVWRAAVLLIGFLVVIVTPIFVSAQAGTNAGTATINYNAQIKIPGTSESARYLAGNNPVSNNLLGQWVDTVYRFCMWLAIILGIFMMMVGGFLWVIAGGSPQRVENAKSYITSAVTGLVLALTSFLLLQTVNPQLVVFKPLDVISPTGLQGAGCCCYLDEGTTVYACVPSTCPGSKEAMTGDDTPTRQQQSQDLISSTCGTIGGSGKRAKVYRDNESCVSANALSDISRPHYGNTTLLYYSSCSDEKQSPMTIDLKKMSNGCCYIGYKTTIGGRWFSEGATLSEGAICASAKDEAQCAEKAKGTGISGAVGKFINDSCESLQLTSGGCTEFRK